MGLQLILILIVCGVLTNFMSAIFGIGGGVLMVPILYTLFPISLTNGGSNIAYYRDWFFSH